MFRLPASGVSFSLLLSRCPKSRLALITLMFGAFLASCSGASRALVPGPQETLTAKSGNAGAHVAYFSNGASSMEAVRLIEQRRHH
jgi:hypothetical protein